MTKPPRNWWSRKRRVSILARAVAEKSTELNGRLHASTAVSPKHWGHLRMGPFYTESELAKAMKVPVEAVRVLAEAHALIPMRPVAPGGEPMYSSQMLDDHLLPIPGLSTIYDVLNRALGLGDTLVAMWLGGAIENPALQSREPDLRSRMWHLRNGNFDGVYRAALERVCLE